MSQPGLSDKAADMLNKMGLTEIKADHIPFIVLGLLLIILIILYYTVKNFKKLVLTLFSTFVDGISSVTGIRRATVKMFSVIIIIAFPIIFYFYFYKREHFGSTPAAIIQMNARDAQDGFGIGGIKKKQGCYVRPTQRGTPLEKCQEKLGRSPPN